MRESWLSFPVWCKETYGRRLYRAALDGGFTCPVRDGTKGIGGCIFCNASGSGDFAIAYHGRPLTEEELIHNHQRNESGNYIAYFQAFTNTYGPVSYLEQLYKGALSDPLFAGISIASRPDCFSDEVYDLLFRLKKEFPGKFIWVELGLQTIHEKTAQWMRRGYSLEVFDECVRRLHELSIPVIVHIILGLPGESEDDVIQTVHHLNTLSVEGVKLQLLQYLDNADLGRLYQEHPEDYHPLTQDEYIHLVCTCIGHLDPSIVIHRLTGDGDREHLIEPSWSLRKGHVLNAIRHTLKVSGIHQGSLL